MSTPQTEAPTDGATTGLALATGSVFEVVDATDDEQYFPVGIFATLAEAEKELAACKDPSDVGTPLDYDDFFAVEIRERKLGWHDHWTVAKRVEWKQTYDEAADEYRWEILSPNVQR